VIVDFKTTQDLAAHRARYGGSCSGMHMRLSKFAG
jgi:hypothetical protein